MDKKILEEIYRIRLLSNYNMKSTLTENKGVILERGAVRDLAAGAKTAEDIARLEREILSTSAKQAELSSALGKGMSKGGTSSVFVTKDLTQLRNADDVVKALEKGLLTTQEATRVYWTAFRNTTDPELLKAVSQRIGANPSFIKEYGSLNKEAFLRTVQNDFKNLGPKQAEELWKANSRRLANLGKEGESVVSTVGKSSDDIAKVGKSSDDALSSGMKQSQKVNVNVNIGGFKNYDDYQRSVAKYGDEFVGTYGREFDDLARQKGHKNFTEWMGRNSDEAMDAFRTQSRSGKGIFGKMLNWGKKAITWKTIKTLAIMGGIGWLAWYLFFKKDGFSVECDEGMKFVEGKGCVPISGEGGGDDDSSGGSGEGGAGGAGGSGGTKTDSEGNKYTECTEPYYKGCVNKKGNNDIKKIQDCLGVTPNGFFNQETEDALKNKINKKSFTSSDIPTICARSYGGGTFQI